MAILSRRSILLAILLYEQFIHLTRINLPPEIQFLSSYLFIFIMPPTLKKWGAYWFRLVRVFVCIHVRDIVLKLHVWIPNGKIADAYFWFSLNYLPLLNYGPLTNKGMKFCKYSISKSIIARNLKLVSADRG